MDLIPPLTRSPASTPKTYCPSEASSSGYPSPGIVVEQHYRISSIYEPDPSCSMAPETSLPPLDAMIHPEWNPATVLHPALTTTSMSNGLNAEYDPFAAYDSSLSGSYPHGLCASNPHTPSPALQASQSPDPSLTRAPLTYPPVHTSSNPEDPRIKSEATSEFEQYPSPRLTNVPYPSDMSSVYPSLPPLPQSAAQSGSGYVSDSTSTHWIKPEHYPMEAEELYARPSSQSSTVLFGQETRRSSRTGSRSRRAPRKLTTKEEANFQCEVRGCGKLFSRSYNFKAHMETHDERREYHFPCQVDGCTKKFVRKTDFQRHHQSVHMKERNHKCDYCGRMFARKDTLRRHMDDGCAKRFDIGTLDLRPDSYDQQTSRSLSLLTASNATLPPLEMPPHTNAFASSLRARESSDVSAPWGR
ncbi:Krueppel-like factor 4 [Cytospora mali]|uniref:Krueppel-like factor 4 n=1 Tax=Cytospora mali TaxID=578113 RepID=A0A194WCQ7_CYTMA|nr:Krueppel-like factor 4 [Valsa mali]